MDFWLYALVLKRMLGVPPIGKTLSGAGLDPIRGYISQRHISAAQYIAMRPIFDIVVIETRRKRYLETILSREHEGIWFRNEGRGTYES